MNKLSPYLSVDCIVFGLEARSQRLKILVFERDIFENGDPGNKNLKFPGSLVPENEDPDESAYRFLNELTGLKQVCLKQFQAFGNPKRIKYDEEFAWAERTYGVKIDRVITIAYYALIRIDKSNPDQDKIHDKLRWIDLNSTDNLAFDHSLILKQALKALRRDLIMQEVNGFELLPEKFTLHQLQSMYETILGKTFDKRNFRKRIAKAKYIEALGEKQNGVAHKPAMLYRFNKKKYNQSREEITTFFI